MRPNYQVFQAMKWLIDSANDKDKTLRMYVRLAYEIIEASNDEVNSKFSVLLLRTGVILWVYIANWPIFGILEELK